MKPPKRTNRHGTRRAWLRWTAYVAVAASISCADAAALDCATYASQLQRMAQIDQALRARWDLSSMAAPPKREHDVPKVIQHTMLADRHHATELRAFVDACGWPTRRRDGEPAQNDAWLLAQHLPPDPPFQKRILTLLEQGVAAGDVSATHLAYFADSFAVQQRQPQQYGTQFELDGPCRLRSAPMDEEARVDARRRALGWPPLAEYRRLLMQQPMMQGCPAAAP